jgi:signal transduction histidine kinase
MLSPELQRDVDTILGLEAVPKMLEVVCRTTGMGFAAVARVTDEHWVACQVRDLIGFGLQPGHELKLQTTICDEIRQGGQAVVIDEVRCDPLFGGHHTPAMYGFQSYISVPIVLGDGQFFGTLCAIDPAPAKLKDSGAPGMFELFAQQIAFYVEAARRVQASEAALAGAREAALLREQFIAVLGHDLRTPLQSLRVATSVVERAPHRTASMLALAHKSIDRMAGLIDNIMDFAHGRLGGGIPVARDHALLEAELRHVVEECRSAWPRTPVEFSYRVDAPVLADRRRIAQLLSNLLGNALKYGAAGEPVHVVVRGAGGGLELSVANAGPVIPDDVRRRLFEPFVRSAAHQAQEGLGLGLYIVAEIARAHEGTVDVVSDEGGTRFTLRIPQAAPAL